MECYCNTLDQINTYHFPNSYTNYYDAQISRKHCSPSISGVKLCIESVEGGLGGIASLEYKGTELAAAQFVWGRPIVLEGGYTLFGKRISAGISAMPHRTGCITDIMANLCLSSHCTGFEIPTFCIGEFL
jgi:hypothetical protein